MKVLIKDSLCCENKLRFPGYFLCRGQISRDYEQEFPSVEVGPRLVRRCNEDSQTTLHKQVSVLVVLCLAFSS